MDEKTQSKVKEILGKFQDRKNEQIKKKKEEERLRREFPRVKEDVIRPTMEEVGKYVKGLGHDYHILESDFTITFEIISLTLDINRPYNPGISIKNLSTGIEISRPKRRHSYWTKKEEKEIVQVEEISKHFVEQKILNALEDWEKDFSKMMRRQK